MRDKLLASWGRFAATKSGWVVAGILVLAVLASISASRLKVTMRWSDLLPLEDPMVQEFDRIIKEYTNASNSIILVQGPEHRIKEFAEAIVPGIESLDRYVERVHYKIDEEFLRRHAFMLAKAKDLKKTVGVFSDLNLTSLLTHINDNFEETYIADEEALSTKEKEDEAVRYLDGLQFWLQAMDRYASDPHGTTGALADSAVDRFLIGDPYFISQDKNVLLIMVEPTFSVMDIDMAVASTDSMQALLDRMLPEFPEVRAGLTGNMPLQRDEMVYSMKDLKTTSVVALVLVLLFFILSFRMWTAPLLAGANLILAIIIAAGAGALLLDSLNIMTSMFAVILIGLGIDYSIHIISVYNERRAMGEDPPEAMQQTLRRSGAGIMTGGITTSAAFFTLMIATSRGIKEMGLILGLGILSAMITTLAALPAFLVLRERIVGRIRHRPPRPVSVEFKVLERFGELQVRKPVLFLIVGILLTGFFVYQALHSKYDYNYLNMEPKGLASVELQDVMIEAFDLSPDFAMMTTSSVEESREIAEKAKKVTSISLVESISEYVPSDSQQQERRVYLEEIRRYLETNTENRDLSEDNLSELTEQLERLDMNIYELAQLSFIGGQDKVDAKCKQIVGDPENPDDESSILQLTGEIRDDPASAISGLNLFQKQYTSPLREKAYQMANPEAIALETLPQTIKQRFMNEAGDRFLVTMYPKEMVWNFEFLRIFTQQLERIDPRISGTPPLMLRLIDYVARDGLRATLLTILVVLLFLWLDFRSLRMALLAMIPLIAGGFWMVGLMKTFGMMFTMVNLMGIPMIVGIGIDDGVHLLHRYRIEGFTKTPIVLKSTGKAIMLTSITTMVGFGSLMLAKYRGFGSLGSLLVLGVFACFMTTVLLLPSIIGIMTRHRNS
ncbi:MAG: MMPL family transporter [Candidatus Zixiibacteriota bacterium]